MSPTDFIIIVFGIIFLLYISKNREGFNLTDSLGNQVDKLVFDTNPGMGYAPVENKDLVHKMQNVLEKEKLVRQQGVKDYQNDVLKAMNIPEFYQPAVDIPFDVKRHEYKLEKNPNNVIAEMEAKGEPLELRKVFNNTVKSFKQVEPENNFNTVENRVDVNNFATLEDYKHEETVTVEGDLQPINAAQSSFCKY
jgi:hypothetical protein